MNAASRQSRWRLVMGAGSEQLCGGLSGEESQMDSCLGFLYDREYQGGRNVRAGEKGGSAGGLGESVLSVPDWINAVHHWKSSVKRAKPYAAPCRI